MDHIQIYIEGTIPFHSYIVIDSELLIQLQKLHKSVHKEYKSISEILHKILVTEESIKLFKSKDLFRLRKLKHFINNWNEYIGLTHPLINENCNIKINLNNDILIDKGISNIEWASLADPYEISEWDNGKLKSFNDSIRDFNFPGGWSVYSNDEEEFAENAVKGISISPKGFYNIDDSLFYKINDSMFFEQNLANRNQQCLFLKHTNSLLVAEIKTDNFDPSKLYFTYRNDIALKTNDNFKMFCNNVLYNNEEISFRTIKSDIKFTDLKLGLKEWPSYRN